MPNIGIRIRISKPVNKEFIHSFELIEDNENDVLLSAGIRENMDSAIQARKEILDDWKEKGVNVISSVVLPASLVFSSKERK